MNKKEDKLFSQLTGLMHTLRSKGGCPWDRKQTHKSLKSCLVEETYEVLDAIDKKSPKKLKEELGDLLYQVIFHSEIANERGKFNINNVIEDVYAKLVHRHPHVFGRKKIKTAEKVIEHWNRLKNKDAKKKGYKSALDDIPLALPALQKAGKVQRRVEAAGFRWEKKENALKKIAEEFNEVKYAIRNETASKISEEIGDLLFAVASLSGFIGIEPETALHQAIHKFSIRFKNLEHEFARSGENMETAKLEEIEDIWNKIKKKK